MQRERKEKVSYRIVSFTEGLMFLSVTSNVTQLNWDPESATRNKWVFLVYASIELWIDGNAVVEAGIRQQNDSSYDMTLKEAIGYVSSIDQTIDRGCY
jgi:hypothetical protein